MATLEETNKNLGALVLVTEKLVESREEEKKDASFFDVSSPSGQPGGMVDSEGNKLVLSKSGNLMQAGADGKATVMSPVGETRKIPNIPSMALPRMGDAGRAGQAEDEAEGTTEPDEEKRNSLLKKMTGFLADQAKEKGKVAKLGLKAFFGTLVFGGFLIALGQFLQSDTFKKATEFIDKTLIPKLKEFYDAFFGPEGGLFKGIKTLFGDDSGIGAIVAGITGVTALFAVGKIAALFSPLTMGIRLLFKGIKGLAGMIPRVPGAGPVRGAPPGIGPQGGGAPDRSRGGGNRGGPSKRPRGRFGALLNLGKLLASKGAGLIKRIGGAKTVAKVAGTAAVGAAAVAATRSPTPPTAAPSKVPTAAPSKIPQTAGAAKPPVTQTARSGVSRVTDKFKHLNKYPLLKKAAQKIPILAPLLSGAYAVQLLMSDAPKEEKVKGIGGLLGGGLGGVGFGAVGTALGTVVPGPGNIIGGLIGSTAGYFAGEWAGRKLAGFLMDKEVEIEKPKVPAGDQSKEQKFNAAPAAARLKAARDEKMKTGMNLEFLKSQRVVVGQERHADMSGDMVDVMGFTGPDAAKKQAELDAARAAARMASRAEKAAASQFSYVASKGKIKNLSEVGGMKIAELNSKLRFLVGKGEMDEAYATKQYNRGRPGPLFVEEVREKYNDFLERELVLTGPLPTPGPAAQDKSPEMKALLEQYEGLKPHQKIQRKQIERQIAALRNKESADEVRRGGPVMDALAGRKPPRGSMRMGLNKVGPQTADLRTAIQKKLAAQGEKQRAELTATQQGGGNTQINNVTKKDGDVTHMPKSDIRNNKFAALNRSAYAAGAI